MRVLVITDGNGARRCDVRIINTGQIVLGTTAAVLATSTTVVTADQWVDVGLAILVFSSTVGQAQLRIWDSAGNVVETLTSTAAHNTLGSGGLNRVQAGVLRSGIASYTAVLDDVDWSTAGYPTISNSTTAGATLSASSSLTANGAGATAATAVLAAVSDMTAVASANTPTAAHLSGLSAADAAGHVVAFGGAALSVASVLTADAQTTTTAGSDLGATSTLTGAATRALPAAVNLSALPAATATAVADLMAGAGLTAASALTATATVTSTEPVRPGRFTSGTYTTTHTPGASSPLLAASAGRSTLTAGVEV
jgi:epidermal growth factor receptor substrate 15